jgi:hypothetical protein
VRCLGNPGCLAKRARAHYVAEHAPSHLHVWAEPCAQISGVLGVEIDLERIQADVLASVPASIAPAQRV